MFANIMQPNMNGVGGTPFASNIQLNNVNGQNGFDTDSFIKILTAIVSGFNNTVMNLEGGLFAGKDSEPITVDEVSKGLFAGNDCNFVAGDALSGILQQMLSQMQLIAPPQPVIALNQDNQKTIELPNNLTSQIHINVNGNADDNALVNFIMKSGDGIQKVDVHTNANSDGNAFLKIKAMADTVDGQEFQNIIPKKDKGGIPFLKEEISNSASAEIRNSNIGSDEYTHIKTTLSKKDIELNFSILNKKEVEPAVNISDAKTHLVVNERDGGMIASASHLYNASYVKNDSTIVVHEPIHASRLYELGEVMEKTVKAGDKHLLIKIEPPDLGSIQIKLRMDNGMLRADLKVDSPLVKDMFSMAIPQIKTSLEDSGIKVSDFFVDVKEDYYSDGRRQQGDASHQNKQNKRQENFFDYFA
jgi:hypothetical protein